MMPAIAGRTARRRCKFWCIEVYCGIARLSLRWQRFRIKY